MIKIIGRLSNATKRFLKKKKNWQSLAGLFAVTIFVGVSVLISSDAWAKFYRTEGSTGFSYGYGYGYDSGYTYGYGYNESEGQDADYGFVGADGKATSVAATQSGNSALVISYSTSYLAKNRIEYGITSSLGTNSSWTAFQTGANSITISSLTCGTTYYYRVASQDAVDNSWYTSTGTQATATCGGGGGSSSAVVTPAETATTTVATTTVATTTTTTTTLTTTEIASLSTREAVISAIKSTISTLIELIKQLIIELQAQLQQLLGITKVSSNLRFGNSGSQVELLQQWLAKDSTVYPEGLVTGYFGSLTKSAVIRFQEKHADTILTPCGLTSGNGYVGSNTRAVLNELYGK